jgi:hypothetical protein
LKDAYEDCGKIQAPIYKGARKWDRYALSVAADKTGLPIRSLDRHIKQLIDLKLIKLENGYYQLASWETVQERFELENNNKFFHLLYDRTAIETADNGYNLVHELKFMAAHQLQKDQSNAIRTHMHFNSEVKEELKNVAVISHWDNEAVFLTQLKTYIQGGANVSEDQYDVLMSKRCDTSVSTDRYNYLFEYHSRGGMAYQKRRWEDMGMVIVHKRRIELDPHTFTTEEERDYSKFGDIVWGDPDASSISWSNIKPEDRVKPEYRSLWLILPDRIEFIEPKNRKWMKEEPKEA